MLHSSSSTAPVAGTDTDVTGIMVIDPGVVPAAVSIAPPPLGTTWFIVAPSVTVTGLDEGFTSTLPFAKSRR